MSDNILSAIFEISGSKLVGHLVFKSLQSFLDTVQFELFALNETNRHPVDHVLTEPDVEASLSHEVPRSTYVKPHHLTAEAQMHRNHENNVRVAKMLEESEQTAFRCATNEKSVKTILKMEQIKLEESRKNEHQKVRFSLQ